MIARLNGDYTPELRIARMKALGAQTYRRPAAYPIRCHARVPSRNLDKLAALPFVSHLSADARCQENR